MRHNSIIVWDKGFINACASQDRQVATNIVYAIRGKIN